MEGAEVAEIPEAFSSRWDELPRDVQQRILVLSAAPCVRRVCKAIRDAFDAVNQTLHIARTYDGRSRQVAKAAVLRVVQRSPSLSAISLPASGHVTLADLIAAAEGLAGRLCRITEQHLHVGLNPPARLQALQQCTGLVHLDVSSSPLWATTTLVTVLGSMPSLTYLAANGCMLMPEVTPALTSALQTLTQLRHLHVAHNGFEEAGLRALAPALSAMPALQTLDVRGNLCMGLQGAEALREVLRNAPGLTHIDASQNGIGPGGAEVLAPALQGMTHLQHLYLGRNLLQDAGMVALAPALAALPRLSTLDLSSNHLRERAALALQQVAAREGSPLRTLNFSSNPLGAGGARALASALTSATQLQSLSIIGTSLGPEGMVALAPAIRSLGPALRTLQLWDINLGLSGAAALAATLWALTGLTSLQLSCRMDAWSAERTPMMHFMSPSLMGLRRLQLLDLTGSRMGASGMVVPTVAGMRRLQALDLSHSKMGPGGAAALAQVLPALAGSLQRLNLRDCDLGAEGAAVLAPALAQTTGLVDLHLEHNGLGPEAADTLIPAVKAMRLLRVLGL